MKPRQFLRRGVPAAIAVCLVAVGGCASDVSGQPIGVGGGQGTTGTGAPPSLVADPACAFTSSLPSSPGDASNPLITVTTTSAWTWVSVPVPEIVVYDDATFATISAPASSSSLMSPAVSSTRSATAVPPVRPALRGYRGGVADPCAVEKLAAEASALAVLDYGSTGILDGTGTRVDVRGAFRAGGSLKRIDVENLQELDSDRLTAAQRAARAQLLDWIDRLQQTTSAGSMLPVGRVRVLSANGAGGGRPPAEKPVVWSAATPSWVVGRTRGCDLFTGRDAAEAVRASTRSSVLNQRQTENPGLVYSGNFVVDGAPSDLTLVVAAPGFGCER